MIKLCRIKKLLTLLTCSALTVAGVSAYSGSHNENSNVEAKTIAEIQEERKQNEEKIAELEREISDLENDKSKEQAYQQSLSEQIAIIQENIKLLDDELAQINSDIETAQTNIDTLNNDIADQQVQVDENIELFKERLCAMYVTGNSSLTSAILGSTDFYDMLSRVEMVNCIAEHDEELVNSILDEIATLEKSKSDLQTEKLTLEMKQEEYETKKQEKEDEILSLNDKIQKSQDEIDRIALEEESRQKSKEELEEQIELGKAQEEEIQQQIAAAAKAEADRLAKEAADRKAQQQQQQQTSNNGGTTTAAPSVTVDVSPTASGFAWPAPGFYYVSSEYGYRWGTLHAGIDIAGGGISGASACASKAGTVIAVSSSCTHNYPKSSNCCGNGYGNYVIVSHGDGYTTLYGHLATVNVSVGDSVSQGQAVGTIGSTGFSTGYHLHFEVRKNGTAVNPRDYV